MFSSRIGPLASKPPMPAMLPPTSPIATARRPNEPGTLSRRALMRTEYAAVGVLAIGAKATRPSRSRPNRSGQRAYAANDHEPACEPPREADVGQGRVGHRPAPRGRDVVR